MKKALIVSVLLSSVAALGFSQTTFAVRNTATWVEAVGGIRNGGNDTAYTITVTGTVSVPSTSDGNTFGSVTGVTVTIEGSGTLSPSANGSLLVIGKEQTIIAKDLTLKGRDDNNASVVQIGEEGTFRMEGKALVTGNTKRGQYPGNPAYGGGVRVYGGTFTMHGGTISGNTSSDYGGGVAINSGTFTMSGGTISGNTASSNLGGGDRGGGGVYVTDGTFTMKDGTISGNTASSGGGVYVNGRTFTMEGGSISGNTASLNDGGGVYVAGTFTMKDGTISSNTSRRNDGGGVYVIGGTFTMEGGTISDNTSSNYGGGVNVSGGTFTMKDNASVSGNTSKGGGGVFVSNGALYNGLVRYDRDGTFTMEGGTISGNISSSGGGVYISNDTRYRGGSGFTMSGGTISGNTASFLNGGGVYVDKKGTFTIKDGTISDNTASFKGGGVMAHGQFTKTGGTVYGDDAEQKLKNTVISGIGHALYNGSNKSWRNAGAGPTMNPDSYGFWLNDGDLVMFPSGFVADFVTDYRIWQRSNFNNTLIITENVIKSSSSSYYWVLQKISGNAYTLKRADAPNTMTLTIRLDGANLIISGDSGSGENNWNGTWRR